MNNRCEGWTRRGGAFTFGPVTWSQCENDSVIMLIVKQDGKEETLPSCMECWKKCIDTPKIEVIKVEPIISNEE